MKKIFKGIMPALVTPILEDRKTMVYSGFAMAQKS